MGAAETEFQGESLSFQSVGDEDNQYWNWDRIADSQGAVSEAGIVQVWLTGLRWTRLDLPLFWLRVLPSPSPVCGGRGTPGSRSFQFFGIKFQETTCLPDKLTKHH